MNPISEKLIAGDIELAMKLYTAVKWFKILLAFIVCFLYFIESDWLIEIIVLISVVTLILPLGFFDVFIQKLLEYNTQKMEERQILNAEEANEHFAKLYKKLSKKKKIRK